MVADWYARAGYALLSANWRCSEGEIDLVLESPGREDFVFCEVKSRLSSRFGTPFDAVTPTKQRRLRGLAARWLAERRSAAGPGSREFRHVRFDVAAVTRDENDDLIVEVIQEAF